MVEVSGKVIIMLKILMSIYMIVKCKLFEYVIHIINCPSTFIPLCSLLAVFRSSIGISLHCDEAR